MPSDASLERAVGRQASSSPPRWLASQGLGLLLGQATVLLLGVGSVVLAATRDGASALVQADELAGFFRPWRWQHLWLYLLLPVSALFALNTALCTWQSVVARWQKGSLELAAWAPTVVHLAFLLALASHLVGGFLNREGAPLTLTDTWSSLEDGRRARLLALETRVTPSGKVEAVQATVELSEGGGGLTERAVLGYNQPLSSGLGSRLVLLSQAGALEAGAFSLDGEACRAPVEGECRLGDTRVVLGALRRAAARAGRPVAVVAVEEPGAAPRSFPLAEGQGHALASGATLRFDGVVSVDAVAVRQRRAPGHPLALGSALVLVVGLSMMGRRWRREVPPDGEG